MPTQPLLTTVVGSYPQPDWLIDRQELQHGVPRIRAQGLWRVPEDLLQGAQDDATVLAIRDMERAGVDIVSDGEARRESYSNRFATALDGLDLGNPGFISGRSGGGATTPVPRVVGPIRRVQPVQVRDVQFIRSRTEKTIKVTVPGPFTMAQQAYNEYYSDIKDLALDYAAAVNDEVLQLFEAGADVVQLDEPWLQARPDEAKRYGVEAIDRALAGVTGTTAVHLCFGYAVMVKDKPGRYSFLEELDDCAVHQVSIETAQPKLDLSVLSRLPSKTVILGVLDLGSMDIETPEKVASRVREALEYLPPERLQVAPDCGMKYLPRRVAFEKLKAMTRGVAMVRETLA